MALRDLEGSLRFYYTTMHDDPVEDLYKPCLARSNKYVRGVAFFRSSVFRLMTEDLVRFCLKGGKMTILTSTDIDPEDHKAALEGYRISDWYKTLEEMLDDRIMKSHTRLLCAMVATGHLTIKVAVVPRGIYHDKVGYFQDSEKPSQVVAFHGSGNESYTALRGNVEAYNVMPSWHDSWTDYGGKWKEGIDRDIAGENTKFEVLDFSEIDPKFLEKHQIDIELEKYIEKEIPDEEISSDIFLPKLRPYQEEALKRWGENGHRGILKHATASGKTITALTAVNRHVNNGGSTVILVPTRPLMKQWSDEIAKYFPNILVGKIGGGRKDYSVLRMMMSDSEPHILISTISSARSGKGLRSFNRLLNSDANVLMVVDECHNVGSVGCSNLCEERPKKSLGLSATPERHGDQEGTDMVFSFLGPVVHEFNLQDALRSGFLVPYEYNIRTTNLSPSEQDKYDKLRQRISKLYAMWKGAEGFDKESIKSNLDILNFKARRIIKGAIGKMNLLKEILDDEYSENQHWLIYCDTKAMLNKAEEIIREIGIIPKIYYSEMDEFNRNKTLEEFERQGGLLLAMKCLDEGINITSTSHGMVLSSTTNPREFIQRRGRMLRRHPGKEKAHIYDAFALPNASADNTGFLLSEVTRSHELAENSLNRVPNLVEINSLIRRYNIHIEHELEQEGIEVD